MIATASFVQLIVLESHVAGITINELVHDSISFISLFFINALSIT